MSATVVLIVCGAV